MTRENLLNLLEQVEGSGGLSAYEATDIILNILKKEKDNMPKWLYDTCMDIQKGMPDWPCIKLDMAQLVNVYYTHIKGKQ